MRNSMRVAVRSDHAEMLREHAPRRCSAPAPETPVVAVASSGRCAAADRELVEWAEPVADASTAFFMKATRLQGALTDAQGICGRTGRGEERAGRVGTRQSSRTRTPRDQEIRARQRVQEPPQQQQQQQVRAELPRAQSDSAQLQHVYQRVLERRLRGEQPARRSPREAFTNEMVALPAEFLEYAHSAIATHCAAIEMHTALVDTTTRAQLQVLVEQGLVETSDSAQSNRRSEHGARSWYAMGKVIGKGTFGRVQLARHRLSDDVVAIKSYYRDKGALVCSPAPAPTSMSGTGGMHAKPLVKTSRPADGINEALEWKRVRHEVKLMATLPPHPALIHFVEAFETPTQMHVVMELVSGGSLCDLLKRCPQQRLPEPRARRLFAQLCAGLAALHAQHVIHRDLKLENVLLDERLRPKIIDFGFSQHDGGGGGAIGATTPSASTKNFCGTPSYMAPEVVACKSYDGKRVDLWSLGVILYVLLCGKFPFQGASLHQLYQNVRSSALAFPGGVSKDAQSLVRAILVVDPLKRLSLADMVAHPWTTEGDQQLGDAQLLREERAFVAFVQWQGAAARISETLEALYALPSGSVRTALTRQERHGLSACVYLTLLTAAKHFSVLCCGARKAASAIVDASSSSSPVSAQGDTADMSPATVATATHKQQLEQLIGLVKQSLAQPS